MAKYVCIANFQDGTKDEKKERFIRFKIGQPYTGEHEKMALEKKFIKLEAEVLGAAAKKLEDEAKAKLAQAEKAKAKAEAARAKLGSPKASEDKKA